MPPADATAAAEAARLEARHGGCSTSDPVSVFDNDDEGQIEELEVGAHDMQTVDGAGVAFKATGRPAPLALPGEVGMSDDPDVDVVHPMKAADAADQSQQPYIPIADRSFSYASLDEHLLALSFRRSLRRRDWKRVALILLGWVLNWLVTIGLMGIFSIYGCEFYTRYAEEANGSELLLSWLWSAAMRFLVNEPFLICFSKGVPMLFASSFCANFCSEAAVTCIGLCFEGFANLLKSLKSG